jgi:hypothetical protein
MTNNSGSTVSAGAGITTLYLTGDSTMSQQSPETTGLQVLNSDFHIQTLLGTN